MRQQTMGFLDDRKRQILMDQVFNLEQPSVQPTFSKRNICQLDKVTWTSHSCVILLNLDIPKYLQEAQL